MPNYPGLLKRGETYYFQIRVPADIVATYGRRFERRSLRTTSMREAAAKLAFEHERAQRQFDDHREKVDASFAQLGDATRVDATLPVRSHHVSIDIPAIARRYAEDVIDREFADRENYLAELERRMREDGSARALFIGEVVPLPRSDRLDEILNDDEIEPESALAVILRIGLQQRLKELRRALTIGKLSHVVAIVEREAVGAEERVKRLLARALMTSEIDALEKLLSDATHVDFQTSISPRHAAFPNAEEADRHAETKPADSKNLSPANSGALLLSSIAESWMEEKARTHAWREKTRHERIAGVRSFIEVCGDRSVDSYRKADARSFKEVLFAIPPNAHKKSAYRGKSLRQIATDAAKKGDSRPTAKNVGLKMDAVASLFIWARQNFDEVTFNPFEGLKPKIDTAPREERDPFTPDELQVIFKMPPFTGARSEREWLTVGPHILRSTGKFWVPLIALYTGARLMEIVQLRKCDIRSENGLLFFDINEENGKKIKTRAARRRIPIHASLISAGLNAHVASIKNDADRLFPDIGIGSARNLSGPASKLFARLFASAGVKTGRNCFHSFRHTFEDACRLGRVDQSVMNALQGHSEKGMAGRYGSAFPLEVLADEMKKIRYACSSDF